MKKDIKPCSIDDMQETEEYLKIRNYLNEYEEKSQKIDSISNTLSITERYVEGKRIYRTKSYHIVFEKILNEEYKYYYYEYTIFLEKESNNVTKCFGHKSKLVKLFSKQLDPIYSDVVIRPQALWILAKFLKKFDANFLNKALN